MEVSILGAERLDIANPSNGGYTIDERLPDERLFRNYGCGEWSRATSRARDRCNMPPDGLQPFNEMLHVAALEQRSRVFPER